MLKFSALRLTFKLYTDIGLNFFKNQIKYNITLL